MHKRLSLALLVFTVAISGPVIAGENFISSWQERIEAETSIDRLGRLYLEFLLEEDPGQANF
jgi:hypothetical protein